MNAEQLREIVRIRSSVFQAIREYFLMRQYLEIDAPVLIRANAVEEEIDPLITHLSSPFQKEAETLFLMTSPEIHMKRLLAHGLGQIFYLGHVFRDNEFSPIHRPEFMMLEWYRVSASLESLIAETETLFQKILESVQKTASRPSRVQIESHGYLPFDRLSMAQAWDLFAQIDLMSCLKKIKNGESAALQEAVLRSGEPLRENASFEDAFIHIMLKKIEPNIGNGRPLVLFAWPAQTASLAQLNSENPLVADRFEIYWKGFELANAFSELTDPEIQQTRFAAANNIRKARSKNTLPVDRQFISDLGNIPPSCGIAVGIDRLLCLLLGERGLSEVLPFEMFPKSSQR